MKFKIFYLILLIIFGCAHHDKIAETKKKLASSDEKFIFADKNGKFEINILSGINKSDKTFFVKRSMEMMDKDTDNVLEQSISFSEMGLIKRKMPMLRPKLSQYTVWFDGKKYFSELKINSTKKVIEVKTTTPEKKLNGTKEIKFPSTKKMNCFFYQVVDCAKAAGFIEKAVLRKKGRLSFYVIWEGYPFIQDTLSDFPTELFSKATLEFDGKTKDGFNKFDLEVAGQSIFYFLDKDNKFKKMFWVSQGISMFPTGSRETNIEVNSPEEIGNE
jgi:hypothetical protein